MFRREFEKQGFKGFQSVAIFLFFVCRELSCANGVAQMVRKWFPWCANGVASSFFFFASVDAFFFSTTFLARLVSGPLFFTAFLTKIKTLVNLASSFSLEIKALAERP